MTRDDEIFAEAHDLPHAERAEFLARACAGDKARHSRVEELLAHAAKTNGFLESPLATVTSAAPAPEEQPRDVIGRYKLLEKIGEGGCGVVWMAEQSEPVRRRVALKVIKLGMDTREVIARFEAERQALALMDHPNIARVFDGGATDTGRPYFVMELVRGLPITRYCDEAKLTPAQRLDLFILVCQAVQHAHQKGVIHRDLKPSNILVTVNDGVAVPKVIDFGIAKATQGPLTDKTVFTAFQQFIGTPVYMSPEQADLSSVDIDTRSDIYSLGVLLYELLTGAPPFDPKTLLASGLVELRRIIREVEPVRPSARVSTFAEAERTTLGRQRSLAPAQLSVALRGDLDWIVMRCLEKDRARRYETANALASDLRRHLAHEPIAARPPSTAYLVQKLVRRHRVGFAFAAAIAVVLVLGIAASMWQAFRATRAEHVAQVSEQRALLGEREQSRLRQLAEEQALATRRRAYAADMNLVQQALATENLGRAQTLLNRQRPNPGELDLRGWEWRYLWQFCRSDADAVLLEPDTNSVISLTVSADGEWLAAGKRLYGELSLLNLMTRERVQLPAGSRSVCVAFSPRTPLLAIALEGDGATLRPATTAPIATTAKNRIVLWDIRTRRFVREFPISGVCYGLVFSADGATLASAEMGAAPEVSVWRVSDGAKLSSFAGGNNLDVFISRFATNADQSLIATNAGNEVALREMPAGRARWTSTNRVENIGFAFSPDGAVLATSGSVHDGGKSVIRLWETATGRELGQLTGHQGWVAHLLFLPDGNRLVSCSADQTIRIWDLRTRTTLRTLRGHKTEVWRAALLPDGNTLVTGCKDGSVYRWHLETDRASPAREITLPLNRFWALADGGRSILSMQREGQIVRYRTPLFQGEPIMSIEPFDWAITDDRHPLVAVNVPPAQIRVWDWARRVTVGEFAQGWSATKETGWAQVDGRFSADGTILAAMFFNAGTSTLRFKEWAVADGRETRSFDFPREQRWTSAAFSPDLGWHVGLRIPGAEIRQIDLQTGRPTPLKFGVVEAAVGLGYSPDSRFLAVPTYQSSVRIFDAATGEERATFGGYMFGVHAAAYMPDGSRLVVGSTMFEALTLWDLASRERVLTLGANTGRISKIRFSDDGNLIAAPQGNQRIFSWRAPSWAEIETAEKSTP